MKHNKKKHKHRNTTGVQGIGSGQSPDKNKDDSSKKQNSSNDSLVALAGKQLKVRTFLLSDDTDLNDLGKEIIAESNKDNPKNVNLIIGNAKNFKIADIEKLRSIILSIHIDINVQAINNIDFTELLVLMFLNNGSLSISKGCNISMDSVVPISSTDLERISKMLAEFSSKDADEISNYYKNKAVIEPDEILYEISDE
jgi:hypothetical protein